MTRNSIAKVTFATLMCALGALLAPAQSRIAFPIAGLTYYNTGELRSDIKLYPQGDYNIKTYYQNGVLRSDEMWRDSVRNGLCKYFGSDGALVKEIGFARNFVLEYKSFLNGQVYCRINKERTIIINKGIRLRLDFDKYYELDASGYVMVFTRKKLMDALLIFGFPEEVTELMKVKFDDFTLNNPVSLGKDVLNCSGGQRRTNDGGVDLQSFNDAARNNTDNSNSSGFSGNVSQGSSAAQIGNFLNEIGKKCGGSLSGNPGGGFGSLKPKYTAQQEKARQTAQQMISNCNNVSARDKKYSMVGDDAVTSSIAEYAIVTDFTGMAVGLAAEYAKAQGGSMLIVEAGINVARFAVPVFAVVGAFTTGYSFATFVRGKIDAEPIQALLTPFTQSELEKEQTKLAAEKQAQREAANKSSTAGAGNTAGNSSSTPPQQSGSTPNGGSTPSTSPPTAGTANPSTPLTEDGQIDPCKAMQSFYDRCERNGWQEYNCTEFVRFANKCKGDIRTMMPTPDGGDVNAIGCGANSDPETAKRLACKRKNMFAYVTPGNLNAVCAAGGIASEMLDVNKILFDPRFTDPVNPLFGRFLKDSKVDLLNKTSLEAKKNSRSIQIVIFVGLNCAASFDYTKKVLEQAKGMDIQIAVVDAAQQPELTGQYNVSVVPTTFVVIGKKLDNRIEGNLPSKDVKNYLTNVSHLK